MNGRQRKILNISKKRLHKLNQEFAENEEKLNELQKAYDNNLDENLEAIDKDELIRIAKLIQEIGSIQNKISINIRNIKEEISKIENDLKKDVNSSVNGDDSPTLELSVKKIREKMKKNNVDASIKIEFDASIGVYRLYLPYNDIPELHVFSCELLGNNSQYVKDLKGKYPDILNSGLDFNIVKMLGEFDEKYSTDLQEKYINNNFMGKIIYDFRKFSNIDKEFINSKQKKQIKNMAKNYKKEHENCTVITNFNKKAAIMLGVGIGVATAGITSMDTKKYNPNDNKQTMAIESTIEEDLEKTDKLPKITEEDLEKTDKLPNIEDNNKKYYDLDGNEISKEKYDKLWNEIDNNPVDVELEDKYTYEPIKVGSIIQLENIDLYYRASDPKPVGNIEKLNCASYKVNAMSATNGNEYFGKTIRNDSIDVNTFMKQTEENYGPLYNISLHIQGLDEDGNVIYEDVGWIHYDDLDLEKKNVKTK